MNGCGSLSVKLCIYQNRQQEGFGLWAIVCLLCPPCSTPPALWGGGLRWSGSLFLANMDDTALQMSVRYYATRPFPN